MANIHARAQIRKHVVAILNAALPDETYEVFSGRFRSINHEDDKTFVFVEVNNEQQLQRSTLDHRGDKPRHRVASIVIMVHRSSSQSNLQDDLDAGALLVEKAMMSADFDLLTDETVEYIQTGFSMGDEGSNTIGALAIRYDMTYRINAHDPGRIII
jgi:hypothetical protein